MTESSRPDQTGADDRATAEGTVHTIPDEASGTGAASGRAADDGSGSGAGVAKSGPAGSRPAAGEEPGSPAEDDAARETPGSEAGDGPSEDAAAGNGKSAEGPPLLPPPWQRTPAAGGPAAADLAAADLVGDRGFTEQPDLEAPTRSTRAEEPRFARASAPPSSRAEARPEPPTERFLDDLPSGGPDLADARTLDRERPSASEGGIGTGPGQVNPPPGGFPAGWPRNRRPRQANLQLKRLDPWSVLKVALVLAVVLYLVWLVAVGVLYGALDGIGVWERLNGQYADLVAEQAGDRLISAARVFGVAAVIGAVNSLLFAVALSVAAFIYNVAADLVGGVEVTLSERD